MTAEIRGRITPEHHIPRGRPRNAARPGSFLCRGAGGRQGGLSPWQGGLSSAGPRQTGQQGQQREPRSGRISDHASCRNSDRSRCPHRPCAGGPGRPTRARPLRGIALQFHGQWRSHDGVRHPVADGGPWPAGRLPAGSARLGGPAPMPRTRPAPMGRKWQARRPCPAREPEWSEMTPSPQQRLSEELGSAGSWQAISERTEKPADQVRNRKTTGSGPSQGVGQGQSTRSPGRKKCRERAQHRRSQQDPRLDASEKPGLKRYPHSRDGPLTCEPQR